MPGRGLPRPPPSRRWGRRPRTRTVRGPGLVGRPGDSAASCRGRGRADAAPAPAGLGGASARGGHRPAQGAGAPGQHRVTGSTPDGCPWAGRRFARPLPSSCPTRAGPVSAGGPASFRRGRESGGGVGVGGRAWGGCPTAQPIATLPAAEASRVVRQHPELADTGAEPLVVAVAPRDATEPALLSVVLSVVKFRLSQDRPSREHVLRAL